VALFTRLKFRWDAQQDRGSDGKLTNPVQHLLRLIEQISTGLREKQFVVGMPKADGTPGWVSNSWGYNYCYVVSVENKTVNLSVQFGYFDEHDDGFYCFIEPHSPTVWRWFKRINVEASVTELQKSIDDILKSETLVNSMEWSTFEEYDTVDL
jgi:hypothetical protein